MLVDIVYTVVLFVNTSILIVILSRPIALKLKTYFSIMVGWLIGWIITLYLFYSFIDPGLVLIMGRLNFALAALIPASLLRFTSFFPDRKDYLSKNLIRLAISGGAFIALLSLTPLMVQSELIVGDGRITVYGPIFGLYILYFIVWLLAATFILVIKYKSASLSVTRLQIKYFMFGVVLTAFFSVLTNLLIPFFTGYTAAQNLGPVGSLIFVGFLSYAIVKHRLMDIRLAIRAFVLKLLIAAVLAFGAFLLSRLFINNVIETNDLNLFLVVLSAALFIVFVYDPLNSYIRSITDAFLFQREYNRQKLLKDLGRRITQSIDLTELQSIIEKTLIESMRIESVKFEMRDSQSGESLWKYVETHQVVLIYDELIQEIDRQKDERLEKLRDLMLEDRIVVVLPLVSSNELIGMILLGEKKGGDAYTSTDVEALEALMYQAAVAIENASLFAETQKFNIKLQSEIKKATFDLEMRNRRLSVLRKLDQIVLNTLNTNELVQKVVDLVSWDMGFQGASFVLIDQDHGNKSLQLAALSNTPNYLKAIEILPKNFHEYRLPWGEDPSNLVFRSIVEQKVFHTDSFRELYCPPLDPKTCDKLQEVILSRHSSVYPIISRGKSLGAVIFDLPVPHQKLGIDDLELIRSFVDEVGIALENSLLYNELEDKNEQLKNTNLRLKELDQMKDELVSVASHELRTPMTVIKSYLWMALSKTGKEALSPKMRTYLERAFSSSERMIELVNDMLSASRLEGKRVELDMKPQNIVQMVSEMAIELRTKAEEKNLKLNFVEPKEEMPPVLADGNRMIEILLNVIGNSVKYTEKGHIDVEISVHDHKDLSGSHDHQEEAEYVWVSVSDTGLGIEEKDKPRLFKKFGKLDPGSFTKAAEARGTGLGLYITKGLIELHGGSIWVESPYEIEAKKGKVQVQGSRFTFSLKIAKL